MQLAWHGSLDLCLGRTDLVHPSHKPVPRGQRMSEPVLEAGFPVFVLFPDIIRIPFVNHTHNIIALQYGVLLLRQNKKCS